MTLEEKIKILNTACDNGKFYIRFITSHSDVIIPQHLKESYTETLSFSKAFVPGGDDELLIDNNGISQTLSFNKLIFRCFIPYDAMIFIRYNNNNIITNKLLNDKFREIILHSNGSDISDDLNRRAMELYPKKKDLRSMFRVIQGGKQ